MRSYRNLIVAAGMFVSIASVAQVSEYSGDIAAGETVIIDLDARIQWGPQAPLHLQLGPGDYVVQRVGPADGGLFTAWNAWSRVSGCDAAGENCSTGWIFQYRIDTAEIGTVAASTGRYATPQQAFAHGAARSFCLTRVQDTGWNVGDINFIDNSGGVSLRVTRVNGRCWKDADGDGVHDDDDLCPASAIPEQTVPASGALNPNHYAVLDGSGLFTQGTARKGNSNGVAYSLADTRGCTCEQIIEASGLGAGHQKFGCSPSAMADWVEWARSQP